MNGWGAIVLFSPAAVVFSLPPVLFAAIMWLVGRIGTRALTAVLVLDVGLWAWAAVARWSLAG